MSYRTILHPRDRLRHRITIDASDNELETILEVMFEKGFTTKSEFFMAAIEAYARKKIFRERTGGKQKQ